MVVESTPSLHLKHDDSMFLASLRRATTLVRKAASKVRKGPNPHEVPYITVANALDRTQILNAIIFQTVFDGDYEHENCILRPVSLRNPKVNAYSGLRKLVT